jgi:hypothetical protein
MLVLESILEVGFITTANMSMRHPDGWTVPKGGVFVFPRGLVHYEHSVDEARGHPGARQPAPLSAVGTQPAATEVLVRGL